MNMRVFLFGLSILGCSTAMIAQNVVVQSVIDALQIDSMIHYVEQLSGETPINLGSGQQLILSRNKNNPGNAVAQAYIEQKMTQFGYTPEVEAFSATGGNVLATKVGSVYPNEYVILCAHYDALPGSFLDAPAADDDGSGTAALLEAARVLYDIPFEYSIVFAFWDEEEQGLVGSAFHAGYLAANDFLVRGVFNMDAIAYDGNGDRKARVHVRPIANSLAVADTVVAVLDRYAFDIDLIVTDPGATYSDHASFWNEGFGAVLMIEEFTNDGNPHYHTTTDRVEFFDVPYYEELAKLSIASCATFAVPFDMAQAIGVRSEATSTMYAYPNPASDQIGIFIDVMKAERYTIFLIDALGKEVFKMNEGMLTQGKHAFRIPFGAIAPGTYSVLAIPENGSSISLRVVRTP